MSTTIGLDLGTSAIKGVLLADDTTLLATGKRAVNLLHPAPNQVEIDPEQHWREVLGLIRELAAQSPSPVAAVAMAAAAGNAMIWEEDGTPRSTIISWLDQRSDWLPPQPEKVLDIVGWPAIPCFPLAQLHWLRRNRPELLDGAQIGMNNDYLAFRLCGRRGLDHSSATPFYLQNQMTRSYHRPFLDLLGLRPEQLPPLMPSGSPIGTLRPELASPGLTDATVIVAGSFDHPAAARALGVVQPGDMLLSCGTSWVGFYPTPERRVIPGELTDPFLSTSGGPWGMMFSIAKIGLDIEAWIQTHFGDGDNRYRDFNEAALRGDTPARQYMTATIARFKARLGDRRPRRLAMAGGPAEGAAWPGLTREVLGIPVDIAPCHQHAGAVGAALIARSALGADAPGAEAGARPSSP